MNVSHKIVASSREWAIVHRLADAGSSWVPVAYRNGELISVPQDPVERSEFKQKYPYSNMTDQAADTVFVYRPMQIMVRGMCANGSAPAVDITDTLQCALPADHWNDVLEETTPINFPVETEFFCCLPMESKLMWGRKSLVLSTGDSYVVPDRSAARTRVLLAVGELDVNGTTHAAPSVVTVQAGDTLTAVTKINAAEVWA